MVIFHSCVSLPEGTHYNKLVPDCYVSYLALLSMLARSGKSHARQKVNHDQMLRTCTFNLDHCLLICCFFTTYNSYQ